MLRLQKDAKRHPSFRILRISFALGCAITCLALLTSRIAFAQASAGITGTITDSSAAVIPDAHVTITNESTAVANHAVTSSQGTYSFNGLLPGAYTVAVDASGFKKSVKKGVTIEVSRTSTINFTLVVGATTETVQVVANQIALNTTQPQLGSTIEPIVVQGLPVVVSGMGRQIDALQFLAPGTTGDTFSHRVSGGVDFEQELVFNGIPIPESETEGFATPINPPFDLVSEFRVERSTFSAQFGLGQGALTYQTKSGTNQYHGSAFEINRNSFFDSVGFFNGPAWGGSKTPPRVRQNNYGFSIGGPVRIPYLYDGRGKTFFNYSQEWFKQNAENTAPSTVPTALERAGNFSDFVDGSTGQLIPIYDPQTGKQFQCNGQLNVICPSRISTTSAKWASNLPNPDRPGSGIGGLDSNKSFANFPTPTIQHVWGFTVDHNLTPTQSLHYTQWRNSLSKDGFQYSPMVVTPNPLNSMVHQPNLGSVFLLNYNNAISPNLVMTAGVGWVGHNNGQFTITRDPSFPAVVGANVPPHITFDGQHAPTGWGVPGASSNNRKLGIVFVNNWLWTKGRHTFNIGGEVRRTYQDVGNEQAGGTFNFTQRTTSVHNSSAPNFGTAGSAFASYLLGLPDSVNRQNSFELRLRNLSFSPYIQDDIKLSPKLTVNVGLRWDILRPFTENDNQIVFFDPNAKDPAFSNIPGATSKFGNCTGCAGFTRADIGWGHVGPRVGFAYELDKKTVVQAGFSIAFLNGGAYEYGSNRVGVTYGQLLGGTYTANSTGSYTTSFGNWDSNSLPAVLPTPFSPSLGAGQPVIAFSRNDGYAPYSEQWNVNVQRELPWNVFLTAAWVGNRGIHLPSNLNPINQLNPSYLSMGSKLADVFKPGQTQLDGVNLPYANFTKDFGGAATVAQALSPYPQFSNITNNMEGSATAYYQSAQIEAEKRFSNGLSFLAGYTLSRQMDNTTYGISTFLANPINKYNQKAEYAISNSDEPQSLKVSGTYELPIGPGKRFVNNHIAGNVVGGWQVGWILGYGSGTALGVTENGSPFPNGSNRPNRNTAVSLSTASYSKARDLFTGKAKVAQMFNPAAFTTTASQYVLGDAMRNYGELRTAGLAMESLNARKHFYIGDRVQAILAVDYFNAFNRTRFASPDTNASSGTFGQVTGQWSSISNRQGQVSFRLEF
jgi:hypothetical protein